MLGIGSDMVFSPRLLLTLLLVTEPISVDHNSSQLILFPKLGICRQSSLYQYSVTIRKTGPLVNSNDNKRPV